jgi:hypothetical protein
MLAILLNKNYILAQKQNLLLTKTKQQKRGETIKWIGNIMHPDFGYPFQLIKTYLAFQSFVQIWESRYYSDELFNVIFTLKSEIYYSNSSIKKIIGSKHYILAAKSEDLEN